MTLQEAKNETAKKYGYSGWQSLLYSQPTYQWEAYFNKAAELYGRQAYEIGYEDGIVGEYDPDDSLKEKL